MSNRQKALERAVERYLNASRAILNLDGSDLKGVIDDLGSHLRIEPLVSRLEASADFELLLEAYVSFRRYRDEVNHERNLVRDDLLQLLRRQNIYPRLFDGKRVLESELLACLIRGDTADILEYLIPLAHVSFPTGTHLDFGDFSVGKIPKAELGDLLSKTDEFREVRDPWLTFASDLWWFRARVPTAVFVIGGMRIPLLDGPRHIPGFRYGKVHDEILRGLASLALYDVGSRALTFDASGTPKLSEPILGWDSWLYLPFDIRVSGTSATPLPTVNEFITLIDLDIYDDEVEQIQEPSIRLHVGEGERDRLDVLIAAHGALRTMRARSQVETAWIDTALEYLLRGILDPENSILWYCCSIEAIFSERDMAREALRRGLARTYPDAATQKGVKRFLDVLYDLRSSIAHGRGFRSASESGYDPDLMVLGAQKLARDSILYALRVISHIDKQLRETGGSFRFTRDHFIWLLRSPQEDLDTLSRLLAGWK